MSTAATASPQPGNARRHARTRLIGLQIVAVIVGAVLGLAYLKGVHFALDVLWTNVPEALDNKILIAVYILAMTTLGASVVATVRRREHVMGHSPLDGIKVSFDPVRVSLIAFATVIITLLSGAVLGPEAGLVALGTAIGTFAIRWSSPGDRTRRALVNAGVLGAIISLALQLGLGQTIRITSGPVSLAWIDFVSSLPGATCAAVLAALIRLVAYRIRGVADTYPPLVGRIALAGALVGACGVVGVVFGNVDPRLVLGSGEGYIDEVISVTSYGTLAVVLIFKSIAYALSLGGGIRGGPIFPAMFLGAAVATVFTNLGLPGETTALVAAGVLAATSVGIAVGWRAMIISGAVIGLLLGSWLLIAPSIYGLFIGRIVGNVLRRFPGVGPVEDTEPTQRESPT